MKIMGFESTAHTFGVGIYDSNSHKILANVFDTYKPKNEGIIPRKAADHHASIGSRILEKALNLSSLKLQEINAFAFSKGPGIGQPLYSAFVFAKYLSLKYNKPLIPVHHGAAHALVAIDQLKVKDPLIVYVSGANTQFLILRKINNQSFFYPVGETIDIGIGNLFDTFSRGIGLEYAHGSVLEKIASKGKYIELPYTIKGTNVSFSGLLTNALEKTKKFKVSDVSFSLFSTAFSEVCEVAERILCLENKKSIVLVGGVAQNKMLATMLKKMAKKHNAQVFLLPSDLNRDNGAMIACAAAYVHNVFKSTTHNIYPDPKWRIEEFVFKIK